ncbi:hypothetical protein F2P81_020670 [Scophthalmus maximus]|uniref:Uncharacterized protein n=1 Tax=Scophthalmus maximus TaxID=52904 RepID=A0A6A4S5U9_SCOMX|nr:hypothetical protein F2P81_020670 [Scophthalmus maximus]
MSPLRPLSLVHATGSVSVQQGEELEDIYRGDVTALASLKEQSHIHKTLLKSQTSEEQLTSADRHHMTKSMWTAGCSEPERSQNQNPRASGSICLWTHSTTMSVLNH